MDKAQAATWASWQKQPWRCRLVAEAPPMQQSAEVISTGDLRDLLAALQAMKVGDFSVRLPGDRVGMFGKIADAFNDIVADKPGDGGRAGAGRRRGGGARGAHPAEGEVLQPGRRVVRRWRHRSTR